MRLKDKRGPIPGGLWFKYADDRGNEFRINGYEMTYGRDFENKVRNNMKENNVAVPDNLSLLIEDQICGRIPSTYCWRQTGDHVAAVVHKFATVGDKIASVVGVNANLKKKASGCVSCNKRRMAINRYVG